MYLADTVIQSDFSAFKAYIYQYDFIRLPMILLLFPITDASSNASIFIDVSCLVSQNK